jgi:hypothetical protein
MCAPSDKVAFLTKFVTKSRARFVGKKEGIGGRSPELDDAASLMREDILLRRSARYGPLRDSSRRNGSRVREAQISCWQKHQTSVKRPAPSPWGRGARVATNSAAADECWAVTVQHLKTVPFDCVCWHYGTSLGSSRWIHEPCYAQPLPGHNLQECSAMSRYRCFCLTADDRIVGGLRVEAANLEAAIEAGERACQLHLRTSLPRVEIWRVRVNCRQAL